jgi:Ran GTPase-activating protein (RanGAP) involved in mRNA processing and transport
MVWGTSRGIDDIIERLQCQDPTLSKLHLFKARRLNHDDAIKLCDALVSNTIIIELNISSHPIPIEMATIFADMLAANDSLISLSLGNSSLGDPAFSILCRGIASNRSLRELHFDSKGITHASCQHLATAIAAHGNIQLLSLSHNPFIGTAGVQHLLPYISTSRGSGSSISTLCLENCGLSADISQDLLESCMQIGSLKYLNLSDNKGLFLVLKQGEEEQYGKERLVIDSNTTKTTASTNTTSTYCSIEELHIERCGLDTKSVSTSWLTSSPTFSHTILPHLRYLNISNNSLGSAVGCAFLKLISEKAVHLHTLICCNTDLALREEGEQEGGGKEKEVECDEIVIDTKGDTDNNRDGDSLVPKAVSDHLGGHNTLTTLDLSGNRKSIGATGLQGLSLSPSLVSLTLHDCDLGSQAPLIIEYLLRTTTNSNGNVFFPVLQDIDLSGNDIQKTEVLGLLQALKMVKNGDNDNGGDRIFRVAPVLKTLVIAANPGVDDINDEVIGEVQVMRPELVIVRRATDTGEQQSGQQQQ